MKNRIRRLLACLVLAVLCAGLLPAPAYAASGTDQNIKWTVKNNVLTISGKGAIPDYWGPFGPNPPWGGQKFSEVVIKEGITSVSAGLFYAVNLNQATLKKVTLPNSLEVIESQAFYSQRDLRTCELPPNLREIDYQAFIYCNIRSVTIPDSVWYISEMAFFNNQELTSVTLPRAFCVLGDRAFASCDLKSIHITAGVGMSAVGAFGGNEHLSVITAEEGSGLKVTDNVLYDEGGSTLILYAPARPGTSYTVPGTVTEIGYGAFESSSLTKITLPSSVRAIGRNAFCGCEKLKKIDLPAGITEIPELAFYQCKALTELTVPEGVTSIGRAALDECDNLSGVTLPKSLSHIGESAFEAGGLKDIYYAGSKADRKKIEIEKWNDLLSEARWHYSGSTETETATVSGGRYALNREAKTAAYLGPVKKTVKSLTIPATIKTGGKKYKVTEIAADACRGLKKLTKVSVGKNVRYIERNAFLNCTKLKKITGMAAVEYIRGAAFKGCKALTAFTFAYDLRGIGANAFRGCAKLKAIRFQAYLNEYWIGANAFKGIHSRAVIRVPLSCLKEMKAGLRKRGVPKTATFIGE